MVSNAAVNPYLGPAAGASDEVYERIMGANVRSNFWLANMVCPQMAERGGGSFIIISSIGGFRGSASLGLYGISKAADMQLARNIAVDGSCRLDISGLTGWTHGPSAHALELALAVQTFIVLGNQCFYIPNIRAAANCTHIAPPLVSISHMNI